MLVFVILLHSIVALHHANSNSGGGGEYEGKVLKGNRNALFLIQKGHRRQFPDFYTFSKMGYDAAVVQKIPDDILNAIPMGEVIPSIPVFRPDDYMYHAQCEDPDRMVRPVNIVITVVIPIHSRSMTWVWFPIWVTSCVTFQS